MPNDETKNATATVEEATASTAEPTTEAIGQGTETETAPDTTDVGQASDRASDDTTTPDGSDATDGADSPDTLSQELRFAAEASGGWSEDEIKELLETVGVVGTRKMLAKSLDAFRKIGAEVEIPDLDKLTAKAPEPSKPAEPAKVETPAQIAATGPLSDKQIAALLDNEPEDSPLGEAFKALNGAVGTLQQQLKSQADDRAKRDEEINTRFAPAIMAGREYQAQQAKQANEKFEKGIARICSLGNEKIYGKPGKRTPEMDKQCATLEAVAVAIRERRPNITPEGAMLAAHLRMHGEGTRQTAVRELQNQVKERAKSLSVPPGMNGTSGKMRTENMSPEQERAEKVRRAKAIIERSKGN